MPTTCSVDSWTRRYFTHFIWHSPLCWCISAVSSIMFSNTNQNVNKLQFVEIFCRSRENNIYYGECNKYSWIFCTILHYSKLSVERGESIIPLTENYLQTKELTQWSNIRVLVSVWSVNCCWDPHPKGLCFMNTKYQPGQSLTPLSYLPYNCCFSSTYILRLSTLDLLTKFHHTDHIVDLIKWGHNTHL